jgi:flagellar biosynthesis protein FlhA
MADFFSTVGKSLSRGRNEIGIAVAFVVVIAMLIIPMNAGFLDFFMILNLSFSLLVVMIVLFTKRTLDFSSFPTILLVVTVFGLGINISSTRLILTEGEEFGGSVVTAFGDVVVGGGGTATGGGIGPEQIITLVVGIIIFIILIAVQFLVITKGATRVAEVAARFTLDAMPGKQMAIDSALSSGSISEEEAIRKKSDLEMEVGFYGAMDGASKFVSGNVQVGILITLVNIIGGIIVGMVILGYDFTNAMVTYVRLTIGDGLVSQIPALLISTATGLIVTRAVSFDTIGGDITKQFTQQSRIFYIVGAFMLVLAIIPGFPWLILVPFGGAMIFLGYWLSRGEIAEEEAAQKAAEKGKSVKEGPKELSPIVPLDPLSLELGYALIPLVDKEQGAELLERVTRIRRESALELGLVVPPIRIIDNMKLEPSVYSVKIKGMEVGSGSIRVEHYMAINPGNEDVDFPGEKTIDPAFGLPALWVSEENRDKAERAGFTVVDPPSIIATHLTEIIKRFASDILGRQEVQSIVETLKRDYTTVVEEATKHFGTGEIQKVLQGLLKEQVSIRNMVVILETMSDYAPMTKDSTYLIEKVRQALARQICASYAGDDKMIRVLTLNPALEQQIIASRDESTGVLIAAMPPDVHRAWINALTNTFKKVQDMGYFPIILVSEAARAVVKASTTRDVPDLVVLSVPEIAQDYKIESLGEISLEGRE